jgi:hypothetical protein
MAKSLPRGAVVSKTEFVFLSLITLGMYQGYWAWRVWETVRHSKGHTYKVNSTVRGVVLVVSNFGMFSQIRDLADENGYKSNFNVGMLAYGYLALSVFTSFLYKPLVTLPLGLLACSVVLFPIVDMENNYNIATKGKYTPSKTNWWLVSLLAVSFLIVIIVTKVGGVSY